MRPHLPAARRQLPAVGRRPLLPQPRLRQPHRHRQAAAAAVARHGRGARALRARRCDLGVGERTTTARIPTSSWPAPATSRRWRRSRRRGCSGSTLPELRVRVVNVVDLMRLFPADDHPHGMDGTRVRRLFTADADVVFAFHGYPRAHPRDRARALGRRPLPRARLHEQGTTTTPFDMVVLNEMSRYHLCSEAVRRARRRPTGADALRAHCDEMLAEHRSTSTSTSRTCPRSATGSGPTERREIPATMSRTRGLLRPRGASGRQGRRHTRRTPWPSTCCSSTTEARRRPSTTSRWTSGRPTRSRRTSSS